MKPSKPFVMPPVRIIPPTLERQSESSKSLEEWLNTEETVRDLHFDKRTEEHMEYSYKSITNCTFSHIQFSACKLRSCHFTDVRFEHCDLSNISFAESSLFRVEFISCKLVGTNLPETILNHLTMKDCNARYLNLSMSKISQARFTSCDLRNSDVNDCKLASIAFKRNRLERLAHKRYTPQPARHTGSHRQYFPSHGVDCSFRHYNKGLKTKNNSLFSFVSKVVHNKKLTKYENKKDYRT